MDSNILFIFAVNKYAVNKFPQIFPKFILIFVPHLCSFVDKIYKLTNFMKLQKFLLVCGILAVTGTAQAQSDKSGYPITPVPFTSVKVTPNTFWGQRLKASREVTIPLAFSKCESENRYTNFSNAAQHLKDPSKVFKVDGVMGYSFDDTDPYKTIEGASYLLQTYPDKKLEAYVDSVIAVIGSAQEPDGYLYTARTQNPEHPHGWAGPKRWSKVEDLSHEFYNLGHLCEAAVAHYNATGKKSLLDIACKFADCVVREVGDKPGQACVVPGHQIAEMGLAKLYLATGKKEYLDQAKFFLDKTKPNSSSTNAATLPSRRSTARVIFLCCNRMKP